MNIHIQMFTSKEITAMNISKEITIKTRNMSYNLTLHFILVFRYSDTVRYISDIAVSVYRVTVRGIGIGT